MTFAERRVVDDLTSYLEFRRANLPSKSTQFRTPMEPFSTPEIRELPGISIGKSPGPKTPVQKSCQSTDPPLSEPSASIATLATEPDNSAARGTVSTMAKKRTDAQRRIRQSDRLARVLRLLQLIQGPGNWNAPAIAKKLDCSERTVYRDLQTLTAAGIPWYFDDFSQSYRLREGYRGHIPKMALKSDTRSRRHDRPTVQHR